MSDDKPNGLYPNCNLSCVEWDMFKENHKTMAYKLAKTHNMVEEQKTYFQNLESLPQIANALLEIKDQILDAAIGKNHIPLDVAKELFSQNKDTSKSTSKILSIVIIVLLSVILFLLTGEALGLIGLLKHPI